MTEITTYDKATIDQFFADRDLKLAQLISGLAANNALDTQQADAIAKIIAGTPPPTTPPPVTTTPPPTLPVTVPFLASSTWNTKVPATGVNYTDVPAIKQGGGWCNYSSYTAPVVRSSPSDPVVTITLPGTWGWPAGVAQLRVPADFVSGSPGTDGSCVIIDGDVVWDFWQFRRTGNAASCVAYAKSNLRTETGWGVKDPFRGAGIHASGSSLLAGLIVGNELTQGINHAVAIACPAARVLPLPALVGGAINSDGTGGPIPYGSRFAIPRTQNPPTSATPQGKVLWKALQEYGAFMVDTTGGDPHGFIISADTRSVPEVDALKLNGVDANWTAPDLGAMANALRRIA